MTEWHLLVESGYALSRTPN